MRLIPIDYAQGLAGMIIGVISVYASCIKSTLVLYDLIMTNLRKLSNAL